MDESNLPFEERETLITVLANSIGYSLYGSRKVTKEVKARLLHVARGCLDTIEHNYVLEVKDDAD